MRARLVLDEDARGRENDVVATHEWLDLSVHGTMIHKSLSFVSIIPINYRASMLVISIRDTEEQCMEGLINFMTLIVVVHVAWRLRKFQHCACHMPHSPARALELHPIAQAQASRFDFAVELIETPTVANGTDDTLKVVEVNEPISEETYQILVSRSSNSSGVSTSTLRPS